jgi:hypothetical protein
VLVQETDAQVNKVCWDCERVFAAHAI